MGGKRTLDPSYRPKTVCKRLFAATGSDAVAEGLGGGGLPDARARVGRSGNQGIPGRRCPWVWIFGWWTNRSRSPI